MDDIIRRQRATVKEHLDQENAHDWPAVYDTFAHEGAIHAVPFHAEFGGLNGISLATDFVDPRGDDPRDGVGMVSSVSPLAQRSVLFLVRESP